MLNICTDTLPQNCLSYLAFRLACVETLTLLEFSRQLTNEAVEPFGYLTEVPFLREVAPQIQIALLAETWDRHMSRQEHQATILDESVVYAVCETGARIVEKLPELVVPFLDQGPLDVQVTVDRHLAEELRGLHLQLSNEGDFLLISQLQDLPPDEAEEFKREFKLAPDYLQPMFDALGRWHVSPQISSQLEGLLTESELEEFLPVLRPRTPTLGR